MPVGPRGGSRYRGEDIGVHLTVNAEYELYRWGPITHAPSLLGGDGGFPRTVEDVWDHADLDEVRRECRAQIERAILWGFDVSHLDAHMGTLQLRPEFFDVYLDLAIEFGLPLRMVELGHGALRRLPGPGGRRRGRRRLHRPHALRAGRGLPAVFEKDLATLRPGVTELHLHPAVDSAELRSLATDDWEARVDDHRMICAENVGPARPRRRRGHPHRLPAAARAGPGRRLSRTHGPMTDTTTTTITGVSVPSSRRRPAADAFDIAVSPDGIEIRRSGVPAQHMAWDRVSEWQLEERPDHVLLTLRGDGAATPLVITGWTLDDLELLLRSVTGDAAPPVPAIPAPGDVPASSPAPAPATRAQQRTRRRRRARVAGVPWKAVVTVALLVVLAAAVTLVLLQSAGVIAWGFLGPTA